MRATSQVIGSGCYIPALSRFSPMDVSPRNTIALAYRRIVVASLANGNSRSRAGSRGLMPVFRSATGARRGLGSGGSARWGSVGSSHRPHIGTPEVVFLLFIWLWRPVSEIRYRFGRRARGISSRGSRFVVGAARQGGGAI